MGQPTGTATAPGNRPGRTDETTGTPEAKEAARSPAAPAADERDGLTTPYLKEVQDFFRQLIVTEKNLGLYPAHSKVVEESQTKLYKTTRECVDATGPLRLLLSQTAFTYEDEEVYSEPEKSRSLSFRIYKDGVREVTILPDVTSEELAAFVTCLKEARKVDEDEDDFITLFWEKDCTNIQVQLADDFINTDDLPDVPEGRSVMSDVRIQRFKIPKEEKERLSSALESRKAEDDADSTFEITEEEARSIREMANNEETYFPLFDFVDILLEVMVKHPDPSSFSMSVKMLRTIIAAVTEDMDFERAADLMTKLSEEAHPGLTEAHRRQLREMLETFTDKQTLQILETFLEENQRLAVDHAVFRFMKAFPRSATESFCAFLRFPRHTPAMTGVLVHLGTGSTDVLAKHLSDPDPLVVRAMIGVILQTDGEQSAKSIARALQHPDESVRLHAAKTIMENGDASAAPLFLPLLEESSKQLLNLALQFFTKVACPDAYERLQALVKNRAFNILDQKRQRLCFKALLRASYGRGLEFIDRAILKRRFFVTQSFRDKQVAALLAMSGVDTVQVREILAEFSQKKKSPLAAAARRALKELDTLKQRQAEQPTTGKTSKAGTTRKMTAGKARKKTKKAEVKGV